MAGRMPLDRLDATSGAAVELVRPSPQGRSRSTFTVERNTRFPGAGGSGKYNDPTVIPPRAFTLSIIYCPPGQGNAAHPHAVEEVFFVLEGILTVFIEDESGRQLRRRLGRWE